MAFSSVIRCPKLFTPNSLSSAFDNSGRCEPWMSFSRNVSLYWDIFMESSQLQTSSHPQSRTGFSKKGSLGKKNQPCLSLFYLHLPTNCEQMYISGTKQERKLREAWRKHVTGKTCASTCMWEINYSKDKQMWNIKCQHEGKNEGNWRGEKKKRGNTCFLTVLEKSQR